MRLIDADELFRLIKEQKVKETGAYSKGLNSGLNIAMSILKDVNQTPTAYDIDKVVEELLPCTACNGHKDHEKQCGGCAGCLECKLEDAYYTAIELVKRGGNE